MMYNVGMKKKLISISAAVLVLTTGSVTYAMTRPDKTEPVKKHDSSTVSEKKSAVAPESVPEVVENTPQTTVVEQTTPEPVVVSVAQKYGWNETDMQWIDKHKADRPQYFETEAEADLTYQFIKKTYHSPETSYSQLMLNAVPERTHWHMLRSAFLGN